jgi:hypothetical protein
MGGVRSLKKNLNSRFPEIDFEACMQAGQSSTAVVTGLRLLLNVVRTSPIVEE